MEATLSAKTHWPDCFRAGGGEPRETGRITGGNLDMSGFIVCVVVVTVPGWSTNREVPS